MSAPTPTATTAVRVVAPARDERTVRLALRGMPAVSTGTGRMFVPETAVIRYVRRGGEPWRVSVHLEGPRRLVNGLPSASNRIQRVFFRACDTGPDYASRPVMPAVLDEFVTQYWPGGSW